MTFNKMNNLKPVTEEDARHLSGGGKSVWDCFYGLGKLCYRVGYAIGNAAGYAINKKRRKR